MSIIHIGFWVQLYFVQKYVYTIMCGERRPCSYCFTVCVIIGNVEVQHQLYSNYILIIIESKLIIHCLNYFWQWFPHGVFVQNVSASQLDSSCSDVVVFNPTCSLVALIIISFSAWPLYQPLQNALQMDKHSVKKYEIN